MRILLKTTAALIALGLSGTAMAATDGTVGSTSTGTFNASLTVTPNTTNDVQILGLEDVAFSPVTASTASFQSVEQYVCFNKNSPGQVNVTFDKPYITTASSGTFVDVYYSEIINGQSRIILSIDLRDPGNSPVTRAGNSFSISNANANGSCNATSGFGDAFILRTGFSLGYVNNINVVPGQYTNTFTLTLAAQ